jgi:co-chaperonin GroES (HSP10)
MIFVTDNEEPDVKNVGGVFVTSSYDSKLHIGKIINTNISPENEFEKNELTIGSDVLLTKGADLLQVSTQKIRIYKKDMIICKVVN